MLTPGANNPSVVRVGMHDAVAAVMGVLNRVAAGTGTGGTRAGGGSAGGGRGGGSRVRVIGVSGPVGAGKSTLARLLSGCVISTDDYLPDYAQVAEHERDLPERSDLRLLAGHLQELRERGVARVPVWSFQSHRREREREARVGVEGIVVCEGLHALHEHVAWAIDVAVFVEAPPSVRWKRWENLEKTGQRGWGVEKARAHFDGVAEPTFGRYSQSYRSRANVIVENAGNWPGCC